MAQYEEYGEYEQPTLVQALKRFTPLIITLVAIAAISFVWLYVIPWPATLNISVVEKDTGDSISGVAVTVSGIDKPVYPEDGPVSVPSRVEVRVSLEKTAGYSAASVELTPESGREHNVLLEVARDWNIDVSGPSLVVLPQTCSVEFPVNVTNNEKQDLTLTLILEDVDERYSPSVMPASQVIHAGETKVFTLRFNAPLEKEVKPFKVRARVMRTDSALKFTLQPIAKAEYDVSPQEIVCPESTNNPPCMRILTIHNRGKTPLQIIVEWTGDVTSLSTDLTTSGGKVTIPAGGNYKLPVAVGKPTEFYWIVFHAVNKGCATYQVVIKPPR